MQCTYSFLPLPASCFRQWELRLGVSRQPSIGFVIALVASVDQGLGVHNWVLLLYGFPESLYSFVGS